jgi:hypothetical protein
MGVLIPDTVAIKNVLAVEKRDSNMVLPLKKLCLLLFSSNEISDCLSYKAFAAIVSP